MRKLFIYATNVHQGGGAQLLIDLLQAISSDLEVIVFIDARMPLSDELVDHLCIKAIQPTLFGRLAAEYRLAKMVNSEDLVLCFGNLPPLFRVRGKAMVFLQNRYLVDLKAPINTLPRKARIRIGLERIWLRWCRFNASQYIVQTLSMQTLAIARLQRPVRCLPFTGASSIKQDAYTFEKQFDFLYVASGEAHKNHERLIDAWILLSDDGLYPSLALTLDPETTKGLFKRLNQAVEQKGLRIYNLGVIPHEQLLEVYRKSGALIYPSIFESFGLPLIEARHAGIPVLAAELDYVRDVIDPDVTFDPYSQISIARAVRRYMEGNQQDPKLYSPKSWLDLLLADRFQSG